MALSKKDFDWMKSTIKDDKQEHRINLKEKNWPRQTLAAYEGMLGHDLGNEIDGTMTHDRMPHHLELTGNVIEDYLLISVNTIAPTLYYQVPRPSIRARNKGSQYSSEVLNSLATHFFDDKAKHENQKCILDAYLPYGIGVMKVGYNTRIGRLQNKRVNPLTGETDKKSAPQDMESSEEYITYERPFLERVSPADTYLDSSREWGKGQRVTFKYKRTLSELMGSNLYKLPARFIQHFSAKSEDNRMVDMDIKEHWVMKNGFAWKLVYTEDFPDELYWGRSDYPWLPISQVRFNKTPDTIYPVSHGRLAALAQKELDYLNTIWKKHVDSVKRQHLVYKKGLTESGRKVLESNEIDGIVYTEEPVSAGLYASIKSEAMGSDVYANINNVRAYLERLLFASGAISGDTSADTATQERIRQSGNAMNISSLQDDIRDFNNDQVRKMMVSLVKFGNPEVTVTITGKDVTDPMTGEMITGRDMQIGGKQGLSLREEIIGDVDIDYKYEVDIQSASRPDYTVIRKQLLEGIRVGAELMGMLHQQGKSLDLSGMLIEYFKTFDAIPNAEKFITDMTPQEQQALAMQMAQQQQQEFLKNASEPTEMAALGQGVPTIQNQSQGSESMPTEGQIIAETV